MKNRNIIKKITNNEDILLEKVIKVINSCRTPEQLLLALKFYYFARLQLEPKKNINCFRNY